MTENAQVRKDIIPDTAQNPAAAQEDTTPQSAAEDIKIPVKFNKEIHELCISEAATLAQKGMKFEMISEDFDRIRQMAIEDGINTSDFITKLQKQRNEIRRNSILEECGGNEQIADRLMMSENPVSLKKDMDEVTAFFPEIKNEEDLPEKVRERAQLTGENLLNCFLRYRLETEKECKAQKKSEQAATVSSIGSLKSNAEGYDAVNAEFLRGLWGR